MWDKATPAEDQQEDSLSWLMQVGRGVTPQGLARQGGAETPARACGVSVGIFYIFILNSLEFVFFFFLKTLQFWLWQV